MKTTDFKLKEIPVEQCVPGKVYAVWDRGEWGGCVAMYKQSNKELYGINWPHWAEIEGVTHPTGLVIGEMYEFSRNGSNWVPGALMGYIDSIGLTYDYIRPSRTEPELFFPEQSKEERIKLLQQALKNLGA